MEPQPELPCQPARKRGPVSCTLAGGGRWLLPLLVLLGLLASGCARLPRPVPQTRPLQLDRLDLGPSVHASPASILPDARWWSGFADPQLRRIVAFSLRHSPTLALAWARTQEAQGVARMQGASLQPQLSVSGQAGFARWSENQFYPPPYGGATTWNNAVNLDLSYTLDIWGGRRAGVQAKLDLLGARRAGQAAAILLLENSLVRDYIDYVLVRDLQENTGKRQSVLARMLQIIRERRAIGLASSVALYRLREKMQQTREQQSLLQGQASTIAESIAVLAGSGVALPQGLHRPLLHLDCQWQPPRQVPADLLGRRPDIEAGREKMEAAAEMVHVARDAFYPDINLVAFAGGVAAAGSFLEFLHPGSALYGMGPAISLPVFTGGRLRGQMVEREAQYDAAVDGYNRTLLRALKEVAGSITSLEADAGRRRSLDAQAASVLRTRSLFRQRFHAGLVNRLPLLQTDLSLLGIRDRQIRLDAAAMKSLATLEAALGGTRIPGTLPAGCRPH